MKNENIEDISEDLDFLNEFNEPIFHQDIMVQKLEKKKSALSTEITHRKKLLKKMFDLRFGKLFFKFKPESLIVLENQLKKYYFSPSSKFLQHFPRLRKKLLYDKREKFGNLSSKINVGSLLYLNETTKKKTKKEMLNKKENILTYSRNFSTQHSKDVINNQFYKYKFWDKNSKRIKKLLSKKFDNRYENNDSFSELDDDIDKNNNQTKFFTHTSHNLNNNIKIKLNNFSYDKRNKNEGNDIDEENKKNNDNIEGNNNISQINLTIPNMTINIEKNGNQRIRNIKYNINKSNLINKNINTINESSLPSLTLNTFNNENSSNKSEIHYFSRNNKKVKTKLHKSLFLNNNSKKEFMEFSLKYKRNLTKHVKELNSHTIKCNYKLFKLIDGNHIIKLKKNNEEFDINNDLYDDNKNNKNSSKNKSYFDYYEIEQLKSKIKNDNINSLIKEARNNITEQDKFKKRELKLFPKKIFRMKDDYALQMVERLYSAHKISKEKPPDIKETVKEDREQKHIKKLIALRKKTKFNHEKIVKMGFFLTKEKDKFFKKNKKTKEK